jgi:phospholipid/cholesterol/gamma-HCH transport system substrate-binding protein
MAKQLSRNIRLGIMVLVGFILLVVAMYIIGDKQNLFGSTFEVSANFKNVNGLTEGNNVRLVGMKVGTVSNVEIINDSTVRVDMVIENQYQEFIKKNAVVSIGTDGLMGNKLLNITPQDSPSKTIQEGDFLKATEAIETEAMLTTLGETNEDIAEITQNLKMFSRKMNDPNSFWGLLNDPDVSESIRQAILEIQQTSQNAASITNDLSEVVEGVRSGKGAIGELLNDDTFTVNLNKTMASLQNVSDSLLVISGNLQSITSQIESGEGAVGTILSDPEFDNDLTETMENLKKSSELLEENLEALKHNILFRRYFKKQAKEVEKNKTE